MIGCAGGNGFDRLARLQVPRVVGADINPAYLAEAKRRHSGGLQRLELVCCDIASGQCQFEPVDLIFAALVFEFTGVPSALASLRRLLRPGGVACAILQRPHAGIGAITPSPFASLAKLAPILRLIPPEQFQQDAEQAGFALKSSFQHVLASGKAFEEILLAQP